jgi:hypothetical protein
MMGIEIHTEEFEQALTEVEMRVHTMVNTLQEVARLVESNTEPLVPVDTTRLLTSFVAVPVGKATKGLIEVEIGYSAHDPRDYYDYAEYTHTGIDYRTGDEIQWHKSTAQREYLIKGIVKSENEAFKLIEGDYLSLFRGLGTISYG